jgi:bifunctional NMN adenylyltransferase/nudix hydrolase
MPAATEIAAPFDLAVFIGRFQPLHKGHLHVIERALACAQRLLIVLGSEDAPRRPDLTPFTAAERRDMIYASLEPDDRRRVIIKSVPDLGNLTLWAEAVQQRAAQTLAECHLPPDARVTLIGCSKDRSSYYLRAFPQWASVPVAQYGDLSATAARKAYFDADPRVVETFLTGPAGDQLPDSVIAWLQAFRGTPAYRDMVEEWAFAKTYRAAWSAAPYPPTFVTADAVVIQGANVLLIRRRSRPGMGLWALPGGFLEPDEFILDAALRELDEETGLDVPEAELRRSIVATRVFDAPFRDIRGRMVTHATLFHLQPSTPELPRAVGADDAELACWVPLGQLRREQLFDDHYVIIQTLKSLIPEAN